MNPWGRAWFVRRKSQVAPVRCSLGVLENWCLFDRPCMELVRRCCLPAEICLSRVRPTTTGWSHNYICTNLVGIFIAYSF